jgi:hypothetical protein
VRLECSHATIRNPVQTFSWDGSYKVLRFDVTVADPVPANTLILVFDVAVEGLPIMSLRLAFEDTEWGLCHKGQHRQQ